MKELLDLIIIMAAIGILVGAVIDTVHADPPPQSVHFEVIE